ncbi:MAG: type II secretion system F family protein [Janthinobacterium lividum]
MSAFYYYQVLMSTGRARRGLAAISVEMDASARLWLEKNLDGIVLQLYRLPSWASDLLQGGRRLFRGAIKPAELAGLLRDLAVMTSSGIPIFEAVKAVAEDEGSESGRRVERVCTQLLEDLNAGSALSVAFGRQPDVFPDTVRSLAEIGDATGTMHQMLMESASHLDRLISLKADARQAMIYPAFSFLAILGAGAFWISYVLPKLVGLFKQMNAKLPPLTVAVMAFSEWMNAHWLLVVSASVAILVVALAAWRNNLALRRRVMHLLHKTPIAKTLLVSSGLAFFAEYLSLLIRSGLDVIASLGILERSLQNIYYKERVASIRRFVERGDRISFAMRQVGGFPSMMVRMIAVGEDSGTLDRQLTYLSDEYSARLKRTVGMLAEVIKPVIVVIAGAVFLLLIVALLLPVYDLVRQTMSAAR